MQSFSSIGSGGTGSDKGETRTAAAHRRAARALRAAAVAALAGAAWASPAAAQETFTLNADGSTGNTVNPNVYLWNTAPWTGVAGKPFPGSDGNDDIANLNFREFNNTDPGGDAHVDIDLNAMTFNIGALNITESGTGNTDGDFQNGTLNVPLITYNTGGRTLDFEATSNIAAGASLLTITNNGNRLNFLGGVTGTGGLSINGTQQIDFNRDLFNVTGAMAVDKTGITRWIGYTGGEFTPFDSITVNNIGKLEIDRDAGTGAYGIRSAGNLTVNSARLYLRSNDDDGTFDIDGGMVLSNGGGPVEILFEQQRTIVTVDGALSENEGATALTVNSNRNDSRITLNGFGNRTGTTTVNAGWIELKAGNALGSGALTVGSGSNVVGRVHLDVSDAFGGTATVNKNGYLQYTVGPAVMPQAQVNAFGAIGGDLSGATYGAAGNTRFAPDAILAQTAGPEPTRAELGGSNILYNGITNNLESPTVGDDGSTSIYRGVAFGTFTVGNDYAGDLTSINNEPLRIYMQASKAFGPSSAAAGVGDIPSFHPANGVVDVRGPGNMTLNSRGGNDAFDSSSPNLVINRTGETGQQNTDILAFDTNGGAEGDVGVALPAGMTVNVTGGRVRSFDVSDNIRGTVNIGAGATLYLDGTTTATDITTGTFNINAGGALRTNLTSHTASAGATINYADGVLVVLDADIDTTAARIPENVDIQVSSGNFTGKGLILANNRRLTTGTGESTTLSATTIIAPAPGVAAIPNNKIIFSAGTGDTLRMDGTTDFSGINLQINDPAGAVPNMVVNGGDMTRATAAEGGSVVFRGMFRAARVDAHAVGQTGAGFALDNADSNVAGDIQVHSGVAYFGAGGPLGNIGGANNHVGNLSNRLTTTSTAVADRVASNIILEGNTRAEMGLKFDTPVGPSGRVEVTQPFTVNGAFPSDDRRFWITRRGGTVALPVTLNNIIVGDGAGFAVQEDNTDVRANLTFAGLTAQTAEHSDWDFVNLIRGSNLPAFNGTNPVVVRHGRYTDGVIQSSVWGTLNQGIQVDLLNGQLFFQDNSVINGLVRAQASTDMAGGDAFIQIRGGQTGNAAARVTGTGEIQIGVSADGAEDISVYASDETSAGSGVPASNVLMVPVRVVNDGNNTNNDGVLRVDRNGADVVGLAGSAAYFMVTLDPGARAILESAGTTGVNPLVQNLRVGTDGIMSLDATIGDSRLHSLRGGGRVNTGDTGGGAGGAERLILGRNSGPAGDVIAPGDSVGTLSVEQLLLEDGFVLHYEGGDTVGDLVSILDPDGFSILNGASSVASVITDFVGTASPPAEYVLFTWNGADPAGPDPATLSGWQVSGEIPGTVQYRPDQNQIVLAVPEPGTAGLLAVAGLGLLARRRRKVSA